ncbi:N-terminal EF-hand calcium-binding protein 2 [Larimichthys crocea]|uniref:Uncharacterized protein n=1 Tax=Larimichthys crocea TaxID=215358 RepID=A0ACD3QDR8_LARCR|nr:N-terminal EF-hand calcium-binding protein 2 [Larimichthys crocea]
MCEQAARYCRDGVHKLLNKEQAKLRAQESREQPKPVAGQDSESATAAQSGNSGAQPGGIDGLVRWIVTKMSDNKNISSREYASSKEEVAVAQEQFFAPEPRRGISVILDIFRRADKDDDGKLSLDEFQAFFSDGTLNEDELEKLPCESSSISSPVFLNMNTAADLSGSGGFKLEQTGCDQLRWPHCALTPPFKSSSPITASFLGC